MIYIQKNNLAVLDGLPDFWWESPTRKVEITQLNQSEYYLPYSIDSIALLKEKFQPRGADAYLNAVLDCKRYQINLARELADVGVFEYQGKHFDASEKSQRKLYAIASLIALLKLEPSDPMPSDSDDPWPGGWLAEDNSAIIITTVSDWTPFYQALVKQGTHNHNYAQSLKAQVDAIVSDAALDVDAQVDAIKAVVWDDQVAEIV